jgi:serine/threonine-protein kinase
VSGVLAGTPEYWAPEQATGESTGPATDLYALGCILFQLVSGRLPFEGEDRLATGLRRAHEAAPPLATTAPDVPSAAAALVDRLLDRRPEARGSALEAALALGAPRASLPAGARAEATGRAADNACGDSPQSSVSRTLVTRVLGDRAKANPLPTLVTRVLHEPATMVGRVRSHRAVRSGRVAVAAVAALVLVGLAGGTVFAIAGGEAPGVDAPDAVGSSVAKARAEVVRRAHDADVPVPKVKVVKRAYSESAPEGVIVGQDPPQGERLAERGALLVSVSLGSAYTDVPSVAGLSSDDAQSLLERTGFVPTKRYAPSTDIAAWHAVETDPVAGKRVKRPAHVAVTISTGPPHLPVPSVDGLDGAGAKKAIADAGFSPAIVRRADTSAEPGTVLDVEPDPGSRAQLGSRVTITVARAPRWTAVDRVEGTEDARTEPLMVPAGDRLVLTTVDTSPLGLFGGAVDVELSGDVEGSSRVDAGGTVVLADVASDARTLEVDLDVHGSAHWALAVEEPR